MTADPISMGEKFEIWSYKVITYMPVLVTFGVFGFLLTFYSYVSQLSSLIFIFVVLPVSHIKG